MRDFYGSMLQDTASNWMGSWWQDRTHTKKLNKSEKHWNNSLNWQAHRKTQKAVKWDVERSQQWSHMSQQKNEMKGRCHRQRLSRITNLLKLVICMFVVVISNRGKVERSKKANERRAFSFRIFYARKYNIKANNNIIA